MQKTIIHPNLRGLISDSKHINWFLYCTGRYTDDGRQDILNKLNIHRNYVAWKATQGGHVHIAYAGHNLHLLYPEYVLHPDPNISLVERRLISNAFELEHGRTIEAQSMALFHLTKRMNELMYRTDSLPEAYHIGRTAMINRGVWLGDKS